MTAIAASQARATERRARRRARELTSQAGWTVLGWVVGIAFFIPVLWMVLTAFKPESAAETWPPQFTFSPTLSEFRLVFSGMGPFIEHSAIATVGSTIVVLVLALPAAYALSIHPVGKWRDSLFFFISTKMLPVVAAIGPLYVIALKAHLLDNIWLLIILYAAMNLPLAIWMIRSFMLEVPGERCSRRRGSTAPAGSGRSSRSSCPSCLPAWCPPR
jgi:sorbitol/mannitol transport system permease protein